MERPPLVDIVPLEMSRPSLWPIRKLFYSRGTPAWSMRYNAAGKLGLAMTLTRDWMTSCRLLWYYADSLLGRSVLNISSGQRTHSENGRVSVRNMNQRRVDSKQKGRYLDTADMGRHIKEGSMCDVNADVHMLTTCLRRKSRASCQELLSAYRSLKRLRHAPYLPTAC